MPQISLYIDKETLLEIEKAADAEKSSVSKWVGKQVKKALSESYTSEFKSLFGSIDDDSFEAPKRDSAMLDSTRETL